MSLGFLPLPLFVLFMAFCSIYSFYYSVKIWREEPKLLSIGFLFIGVGTLSSIPYKVAGNLNILNSENWILAGMGILGLAALISIIIGGYQKVWYEPQKRKKLTFIVAFLIIDLILAGLLVIHLIYFV